MNRIELILLMDRAITEFERAQKKGNQVCMDIAELIIDDCKQKLGIENETDQKIDSAVHGQSERRSA